jgi:hypothetical protein
MHEQGKISSVLIEHFFRRFFDSDTVKVEGETLTTVIRAVSTVAVPGLMVSFFLLNQYPRRSLWGSIEDQYFFVLFSFVVMGAAAVFEWEMLFPDRLDFLVLSPLPVKPLQLLAAKAAALIIFLSIFLAGSNVFGTLVLPLISQGRLFRQFFAHSVAVALAGLFASLFFLALAGLLLCVLGAARFRTLSPLIQMVSVTALLLLMMHYVKVGNDMHGLLTEPLGATRWVPSLWFLGVYEYLLHGNAAPAFARPLAGYGIRGILIVTAVVLLTYPTAWIRMRRMAIEGMSIQHYRSSRWLQAAMHRLVRRPGERAAFHFIGQTIIRNNHYQVYLAMYCGTGLALAIACAVALPLRGRGIHLALSDEGLHAVMPLLLFWVIAGLRTAFAFPMNLAAGWVFRITGVSVDECAGAAWAWVFVASVLVMGAILIALRIAGWDARHLVVQLVCGLCLSILLTDGFFSFQRTVPFNQPRMPGKTSLPLMLTLYIGVFPPFIFGMIYLEKRLEMNPAKLALLGLGTLLIHAGLGLLRSGPPEIEEELEGYDGEFQLLGLSIE